MFGSSLNCSVSLNWLLFLFVGDYVLRAEAGVAFERPLKRRDIKAMHRIQIDLRERHRSATNARTL